MCCFPAAETFICVVAERAENWRRSKGLFVFGVVIAGECLEECKDVSGESSLISSVLSSSRRCAVMSLAMYTCASIPYSDVLHVWRRCVAGVLQVCCRCAAGRVSGRVSSVLQVCCWCR